MSKIYNVSFQLKQIDMLFTSNIKNTFLSSQSGQLVQEERTIPVKRKMMVNEIIRKSVLPFLKVKHLISDFFNKRNHIRDMPYVNVLKKYSCIKQSKAFVAKGENRSRCRAVYSVRPKHVRACRKIYNYKTCRPATST